MHKSLGTTIFLAPMAAASVFAQQDFSKVEIKSTHVAGNVHMLEGSGGNIGVSVGPDGILIVDDQFAPLAEKIKAALKKLGEGKLAFVLNTHWHGDHTGGNPEFGKDSVIVAHANVRKRLAQKETLFGREVGPMEKAGLPVVTFDHSLSIHFNGEEIKLLHLPKGHTDGDSVVFFTGSNVVHMGDLLFHGTFPFIDLEHGGDVEGYAANVATVLKQLKPEVKVIPGHGALATPEDLRKFHDMLVRTTDVVRKRIADGMTIEPCKSEGLPEEWKSWGNGFIKTDLWIECVFDSLTRKK